MSEHDEPRSIRIIWETDGEGPAAFANQFIIQHQRNEFFLTIGQLIPPAILGDAEEKARQLAELNYIPVKLLGKMAFTRDRMVELIALLQENLENHDKTTGGGTSP